MRCQLIASTTPAEHANGAPGLWHVEYRVRELTEAERSELLRQTGKLPAFVLEERYSHEQDSEYCTVHRGAWTAWDYGQTAKEAALSCSDDTAYASADSLHALHEAVKAKAEADKARAARIAELRAVLYQTWTAPNGQRITQRIDVKRDEQGRAKAEFEAACKAARIWSKVQANTAPQDQVAAIKARVLAAYRDRLAVRETEQTKAARELAELEAR